jgi:hypothetical protein
MQQRRHTYKKEVLLKEDTTKKVIYHLIHTSHISPSSFSFLAQIFPRTCLSVLGKHHRYSHKETNSKSILTLTPRLSEEKKTCMVYLCAIFLFSYVILQLAYLFSHTRIWSEQLTVTLTEPPRRSPWARLGPQLELQLNPYRSSSSLLDIAGRSLRANPRGRY